MLNCTWVNIPCELWPRARIPHSVVVQVSGHSSTLNHDSDSQWNVEFRPVVIIQRGIKTWGNHWTWYHDPRSYSQHEILTWVTIQRGIMTWGHISTWNSDPESQGNVEWWPRVGRNFTLNYDPGSEFHIESRLEVTIQQGSKFYMFEGL